MVLIHGIEVIIDQRKAFGNYPDAFLYLNYPTDFVGRGFLHKEDKGVK